MAAAILKIWKISISPQLNDQFWWNLVQWCVWALQTPSANKILRIQQSKMAAAAILKNRKMLSSQPIDWLWWNFACCCASNLCRSLGYKMSLFKNLIWQRRPFWKFEKSQISPQLNDQFWRNLVQLCVWALRTPSANKILRIWQSKMAAAVILKKRKILIPSQPATDFDKIWHGDVRRSSWPYLHIKFYAFKNSTWLPIAIWKV